MPPPLGGSRPGWPEHGADYDRCGDFVKGIARAQGELPLFSWTLEKGTIPLEVSNECQGS